MHKLLKAAGLAVIMVAIAVGSVIVPSHAVEPDEILADSALEARARALSAELRCLVCQNQSIDDSNAPLARDLRILVRERLKAGDNNGQILDYVVARYGEFVLLRPRFNGATLLLWLSPLLILVGGLLLARNVFRTQKPVHIDAPKLSDEDEARLAEILREQRSGE